MGMNLDGPIYLQRKQLLTAEKNKLLDIGPQNVYFAKAEQITEFVANQGQIVSDEDLVRAITRLVYFSNPRAGERTTLFSEITDLTNIEYNSFDVCPGLKTEILDLNFDSLPDRLLSYYDVVLNFGTTEHIFNQLNCFEVMHAATKVGGVMYHQLPASGYFDHGFYCYTPLFFQELAEANDYELMDLFVTSAGETFVDRLQISARDRTTILKQIPDLSVDNRIPALNIHVILRRTAPAAFRCALETATTHAPIDQSVASRYRKEADQGLLFAGWKNALADKEAELNVALERIRSFESSTSWKLTAPLRAMASAVRQFTKTG
jgi:hypothetical protein